MEVWPVTLPARLLAGASVKDDESRATSDMDAGPASVRNRFTAITQTVKGSIIINGSQLATFYTFFRTNLKNGSLSFTWIHPFTEESVEIRFVDKPEWVCVKPAPTTNDRLYQATLNLQIQP